MGCPTWLHSTIARYFIYEVNPHFSVAFKDMDERYVESNPADSEGWYISKLISVPNSREGEVTRKTGSLRRKYGVVYTLFYGRIRIPRNAGNIDACADSVYQALFFCLWKRAWGRGYTSHGGISGFMTLSPTEGIWQERLVIAYAHIKVYGQRCFNPPPQVTHPFNHGGTKISWPG